MMMLTFMWTFRVLVLTMILSSKSSAAEAADTGGRTSTSSGVAGSGPRAFSGDEWSCGVKLRHPENKTGRYGFIGIMKSSS